MMVIQWAWHRLRPQVGWLPLFLLVAAVACAVVSVLAVEWVPQDGLIVPAAVLGLWMGLGLGQRPLRGWLAWLFIAIYGLLWTTWVVANLWPAASVWGGGWQALRLYWLGQGAIFADKFGGWLQAVAAGNSSQETLPFVFGLGLLAWLLAAYVGWTAWRHKRPLLGLSLMGLAVAVNSYFGAEAIGWTAAFIAMASLATAVMHYISLEQDWQSRQIDYSTEIGTDLAFYAAIICLALLLLALLLPAFSISRLARFLRQQEVVQQAESTLSRSFAGVRQPAMDGSLSVGTGSSAVMPRAYLLGDAPELRETVVMTAVVSPQLPPSVIHWRGLSYDIYTGRGWASSEERQERVAVGEVIALPAASGQSQFEQSVHWLLDERAIRYTVGLPYQFDQDVVVTWRGLADLVRVHSDSGTQYRALSQVTTAVPALLPEDNNEAIPAVIQARYTQLPPDLPARIGDLAQQVAGAEPTPFAQALALQTFLRQYRYSLHVPSPPRTADPVDYFLFEQQAGYCDYFASAMTVMARSLGLPARLVAGYMAQPPDANGVQTIYEINGHSWTEIYFAGLGWVEFEPTAVFTPPAWAQAEIPESVLRELNRQLSLPEPLPLPQPDLPLPWGRWALLLLLLVGLLLWRRRAAPVADVVWLFGRLQKQGRYLGRPMADGETALEFAEGLQGRLEQFGRYAWLQGVVAQVGPQVRLLTWLFNGRQYGREVGGGEVALAIWRRLKRPFWLLRLVQWLKRP